MNQQSPPTTEPTNSTEGPQHPPPLSPQRKSALPSPRSSPRRFAEKRSLYGKAQRLKRAQTGRREEREEGATADEEGSEADPSTPEAIGSAADGSGARRPPAENSPRRRRPLPSPPTARRSGEAEESSSVGVGNASDDFDGSFDDLDDDDANAARGDGGARLEAFSATPGPRRRRPAGEGAARPPYAREDEFSEVFGGGLRALGESDLTRRVLGSAVFREGATPGGGGGGGDAGGCGGAMLGGADSFDRESAFFTENDGEIGGFRSFGEEGVDRANGLDEEEGSVSARSTGSEVVVANDGKNENKVESDVQVESYHVGDDAAHAGNLNCEERSAQILSMVGGAVASGSYGDTLGPSQSESLSETVNSSEQDDDASLPAARHPSQRGEEEEKNSEPNTLLSHPSDKGENTDTSGDAQMVDELNTGTNDTELSSISMERSTPDTVDGPRSSPIDPKLMRRHKMASRVASGKVNVPKSFLSAAASSANVVASLENATTIVVEKRDANKRGDSVPSSPTNAPMTQQEASEVIETKQSDAEVVDELNINNHSQNEFELSNISMERPTSDAVGGPRSSPVDPKLRRRHKMASRVASGKVNVPKSYLSAAATSANAVAELENGVKITVEKDAKRGGREGSPRQIAGEFDGERILSANSSPITNSNILPSTATLAVQESNARVNSSEDVAQPNNAKPSITAISTEQSVELHASLDELLEFSLDSTCPSLSPSKLQGEPSQGKDSNENDISFDSANSLNISRDLDKNEARRQRRQLRRKDVSITMSQGEEKNSKDLLGFSTDYFEPVDEDEAKALFPLPSFDDTSALDCPMTTLDSEPAWDQNATSGLDAVLEQSKARNKAEDGKPLLELDAVSSDANGDSEHLLAAKKLLSQQERMTMYTSGEAFGVGEDSSVEVGHGSENDVDESFDVPREYQTVDNENEEGFEEPADTDTFDFIEFGKGSHEEFSAAGSSAVPIDKEVVSDQTIDVVSDTGRGSDFFDDANSSTTGGGTVLGLRFIESSDSYKSRPTPPGSPADLMGLDITSRVGVKQYVSRLEAVKEGVSDGPKLFKIAPPPEEKLRLWEESKRGSSAFKSSSVDRFKVPDQGTPKHAIQTLTPKGTPPQGMQLSPTNTPPSIRHETTLNLKISTPKSPKKKPHSINEELNLSSHTKMAEKIAIASSKASKKFEEQYSHIEHDNQYAQSRSPDRSGKLNETRSRFLCDSGISFVGSAKGDETEADHSNHSTPMASAGPGVVELVGGAFSPWKIPDRADEESNASSSRVMYDDESYAKASVAALNAIRGKPEFVPKDTNRAADMSEVSIDLAHGDASLFDAGVEDESLLSDVLVWLFGEVLPSNAFSAFDINTSTSVQAARVFAIANDDKSFNLICRHVTDVVIKQHGNTIGSPEKQSSFATEISSAPSSGDLSTSTYESSQVTSIASSFTETKSSFSERAAARILKGKKQSIEPFSIPIDARPLGEMLAANFISFLQQISKITGIPLPKPFDENPFLQSVVNLTTKKREHSKQERKSMQELVFDREDKIVNIFVFLKQACGCESQKGSLASILEGAADNDDGHMRKAACHPSVEWEESLTSDAALEARLASGSQTLRRSNKRNNPNLPGKSSHKGSWHRRRNLNFIFPKSSPSPFETAVWNDPSIMLSILSFLGNPVSVCIIKRLNVFCNRLVSENEHVLMRDAVRLGGMSKFVRPSFWLWVTMERCSPEDPIPLPPARRGHEQSFSFGSEDKNQKRDFFTLKDAGAAGKWQPVIERDVLRAFGNMPPHKTGAKYRQDSIVRALVSFGKEEIMRNSRSYQTMDKLPEESEARHFKLSSRLDQCADGTSDDSSEAPTDTVSDWGGISPVGSMVSEEPSAATAEDEPIIADEVAELLEVKRPKSQVLSSTQSSKSDVCDPVLSGNALTNEMKMDLQNKLRSILHALAAQHEGLGYCQGMDYIVAHLLRVLQDTILLRVIQGSMPIRDDARVNGDIVGVPADDWKTMPADQLRSKMSEINSRTMVVDEVVFRVMDAFFTTYGLQHMYWPELRCLKTCCRVFESLIKQKLPVLADHFEHHDLNVGLFALGWFQTLFLYLPSMPSATVCHMWDIWLVERSFKIFFRVGTAILFLSQPTLLNHDLEGMMTYLNTFPDATLLRRDILIPCALQIKITNRMLVEIEMDITNFRDKAHDNAGGEHYSMY